MIARFDQMSTPFQAILWGRVLPLDTFDQAKIMAFWEQWGGRTNLGRRSARPRTAPPTRTPAEPPNATPGPSAAPSAELAAPAPATADRHAPRLVPRSR